MADRAVKSGMIHQVGVKLANCGTLYPHESVTVVRVHHPRQGAPAAAFVHLSDDKFLVCSYTCDLSALLLNL